MTVPAVHPRELCPVPPGECVDHLAADRVVSASIRYRVASEELTQWLASNPSRDVPWSDFQRGFHRGLVAAVDEARADLLEAAEVTV